MFQATRTIEYADLDTFGVVYFPNFVRFMEETEYAWLRSIGLSVVLSDERGSIGFPRLRAEFDVVENVGLGAELTIEMDVLPSKGKQIEYVFRIRNHQLEVAKGRFVAACCRFPGDRLPYAIPIPDWVLEKMFGVNAN